MGADSRNALIRLRLGGSTVSQPGGARWLKLVGSGFVVLGFQGAGDAPFAEIDKPGGQADEKHAYRRVLNGVEPAVLVGGLIDGISVDVAGTMRR